MAVLTETPIRVQTIRPRDLAAAASGFDAWIDAQADRLSVQGDPWSLWLAARLRETARTARFVRADDPEDLDDREAVLADARLANLAVAAGPRQAASAPAPSLDDWD